MAQTRSEHRPEESETTDAKGAAAAEEGPADGVSKDKPENEPTHGKAGQVGLSDLGKVLVMVAIALWLGFFLGGIVVDTRPFRKAISAAGLTAAIGEDEAKLVGAYSGPPYAAVAMAFLFFTPINLAMLTLLAGLLGTLGRKASLYMDPNGSQEADPINPKLSAFLRSYLVYLLFLSGVLVFADEPFSAPSPASYLRLAGVMSLSSFAANYRPSFFARMLQVAHGYIDSKSLHQAAEEPADV